MALVLVNHVQKTVDKGDCEGKKGYVEIYACGTLIEMGWWKVMIKRQRS